MPAYSPERRTAVVLSGTGVHGAYLAGALRALQESGIKIDVVAGHGAGAANAALAAIDGQSRLWDPDGLWLGPDARAFYAWTRGVRTLVRLVVVLAALLLVPLVATLASGLVVYSLGFLMDTLGVGAGAALVDGYNAWLQRAFASDALPTLVPRLGMLVVVALAALVTAAAVRGSWLAPRRRSHGAPWWRVVGAPLDAGEVQRRFQRVLWQLIRSAGAPDEPTPEQVGRRYAEVLSESLGQPGFREVIVAAADLDARRDVVGVVLRDAYATEFMAAKADRERRADVLNLGGQDSAQAVALVAACLTPPVIAEPQAMTFAATGHWKGETHRLCDRPGMVHRLLEEVSAAGVTQVVVVTACAEAPEPHQLRPARLDARHRAGDFITAAESAALRDALQTARLRFDAVYVIRPEHNPLGPFDTHGAYDGLSDRLVSVAELVSQGHDDASRQFVEPVVGASGERLGRTSHVSSHSVADVFVTPDADDHARRFQS